MPWNRRITLIADEAERDFKKFRDRIVLGTHRDLVLSSPVDTGRYRGNHAISHGVRRNTPMLGKYDKGGSRTLAEGAGVLVGAPTFTVVYIQNALSYAGKLEQGTSPQAREGIYKPAVRRLLARYSS